MGVLEALINFEGFPKVKVGIGQHRVVQIRSRRVNIGLDLRYNLLCSIFYKWGAKSVLRTVQLEW